MIVLTVGSSSSGNCTYIYNEDTHILIDCGVSAKKVFEKTGRKSFDALFISHEHADHISGAGPIGRKTSVPVHLHEAVFKKKEKELNDCTVIYIDDTSEIKVGSFIVKPFSTKHDAAAALGFIIEEPATKVSLCYMTDTGSISKTMKERTKNCNAFFIECDYDEELLEVYEEYNQELKERIRSNFGHLSNEQALDFLADLDMAAVKGVIIGHISPRTNSPEKIKERIQEKLAAYSDKFLIAPFEIPLQLK